MKEAMKAKDSVRLSVIRGLLSGFTNELVAQKKAPSEMIDDDGALAVIKRAAKQRKDSIEQFESGGRPELAEGEKAELAIIEEFLPEMMSEEAVREVVAKKKEELGISAKSGMGELMKAVMAELRGAADGAVVKSAVDEALS